MGSIVKSVGDSLRNRYFRHDLVWSAAGAPRSWKMSHQKLCVAGAARLCFQCTTWPRRSYLLLCQELCAHSTCRGLARLDNWHLNFGIKVLFCDNRILTITKFCGFSTNFIIEGFRCMQIRPDIVSALFPNQGNTNLWGHSKCATSNLTLVW